MGPQCLLYRQKQTFADAIGMSALCQKRTLAALFAQFVSERPGGRLATKRRWRAVTQIEFAFAGLAHRQFKMKDAPSGRINGHPDPTIVALDYRLTDRKTHSHAAGFGREHWLKNAVEVG
jgi:hypothetical protein